MAASTTDLSIPTPTPTVITNSFQAALAAVCTGDDSLMRRVYSEHTEAHTARVISWPLRDWNSSVVGDLVLVRLASGRWVVQPGLSDYLWYVAHVCWRYGWGVYVDEVEWCTRIATVAAEVGPPPDITTDDLDAQEAEWFAHIPAPAPPTRRGTTRDGEDQKA